MKIPWQVRRVAVGQSDEDRRWDYAYQFLLQWAMAAAAGSNRAPAHAQEDPHGSRALRPGLNHSSATAADD